MRLDVENSPWGITGNVFILDLHLLWSFPAQYLSYCTRLPPVLQLEYTYLGMDWGSKMSDVKTKQLGFCIKLLICFCVKSSQLIDKLCGCISFNDRWWLFFQTCLGASLSMPWPVNVVLNTQLPFVLKAPNWLMNCLGASL